MQFLYVYIICLSLQEFFLKLCLQTECVRDPYRITGNVILVMSSSLVFWKEHDTARFLNE